MVNKKQVEEEIKRDALKLTEMKFVKSGLRKKNPRVTICTTQVKHKQGDNHESNQ